MRAYTVSGIALAGLVFSLLPIAHRVDDALMDVEWTVLRKFAPRAAPDDIIIVGVDSASVRSIVEPRGLWHAPLGRALERVAAAKPRAIGLTEALPERSYDDFHPGLDQPLLEGLASARRNGPVVAALSIEPRTRGARVVHAPFLAVLGEQGLGLGLAGRDADGTTRRFALAIPTEDGSFPTLAGRLCRALSRRCTDGLIDFSLGPPYRYVPLHEVLETRDEQYLQKLFRDRIVMIGDVQLNADRIEVPLNLAGWESGGRLSPSAVVHAQSLRTALAGAPEEAARPLAVVIIALAALVALVADWRLALATAALGAVIVFAGAIASLRAGTYVPVAPAFATLVLACLASALQALRARGRARA